VVGELLKVSPVAAAAPSRLTSHAIPPGVHRFYNKNFKLD
jgi:hypothetical protein